MALVITGACIGVKDGSCVDVCPVDCIHPGPDEREFDSAPQLYIDPAECIECDICMSVCPVDAIYHDVELPPDLAHYAELNAAHYGKATAAS